jgi:hypothetical protein
MSGDFNPRNCDSRNRDDGIHDRDGEARGRDCRDRDDERSGSDPRDVLIRDLDLPQGPERELVHDRDREYALSGSDTRTLSTVGAFRVVAERDLRDARDGAFDVRESDLRHLEGEGLIQRVSLDGRERAVTLSNRRRSLLEHHRTDRDPGHRQRFAPAR